MNAPSPRTGRRVKRFLAAGIAIAAAGVFVWWMWFSGPPYEFTIVYSRYRPKEMRFSPDGRYLAVVGQEAFVPGKKEHEKIYAFETPSAVRVLGVSQGNVIAELPSERVSFNFSGDILQTTIGMICCAWNADGSTLAVGRSLAGEINLFDTKTWKMTDKLASRDIPADWHFRMTDLSFDRWGNLYAAEGPPNTVEDPLFHNPERPVCVWWNVGTPRPELPVYIGELAAATVSPPSAAPVVLGSLAPVLSLSVASFREDARLAISYGGWFSHGPDTPCPIEIRRVVQQAGGTFQVRIEGELEDDLNSEDVPMVCFVPDGIHIAVLTNTGFRLWKLPETDGNADLIASVRLNLDIHWNDPIYAKLLDVSRDSRFVTYTTPLSTVEELNDSFAKDLPFRTTVVRVADGAQVFAVSHPNVAAAISPDGTLLAVGSGSRERICFYRIPQDN